MGHHISAVIVRKPIDRNAAQAFDMRLIALPQHFLLIPLDAGYCDHWSDALGIQGFVSEQPLLNCEVVHHMMAKITTAPFAVIETDYFGGVGAQCAAVYRGSEAVMAPRQSANAINEALHHLGVHASKGCDAFDTVGLGRYRSFDDCFDKYRE